MVEEIVFAIDGIVWIIISVQYLLFTLNLYQQHEYDSRRFIDWGIKHYSKISRYPELVPIPFFAALLFLQTSTVQVYPGLFTQLLFIAVQVWSFLLTRRRIKRNVKPLVLTPRAYRLLIVSIILTCAEILLLGMGSGIELKPGAFPSGASYLFLAGLLVLGQALAVNLILANLVLYPVDEMIKGRYINSARKKLRSINPIVIGITGSYGKTSTKHILSHIMSEKYELLSTPKSYNTLMGICRVINESLEAGHKYFIVEMGTYKKGEIKTICELVNPKIGILTAVGPQHLERFHTLENIAEAKFELIESLPQDGTAIFNYDNSYCRQLALKTRVKTLGYGIEFQEHVDILAQKISVDMQGTKFEMVTSTNQPRTVRMQLLGRQNVSNALGAVLAAIECGISLEQATHSLASLLPVEHRMQLMHTPQGITLIDNAYSSNPISAQFSLEVFNALECKGRKILVTPGFAELGKEQDREHFILGQKAAEVSDAVFLIGNEKRVSPIIKGLLDKGFLQDDIHVNLSMQETRKAMAEFLKPGDIVLIENDLPDVY